MDTMEIEVYEVQHLLIYFPIYLALNELEKSDDGILAKWKNEREIDKFKIEFIPTQNDITSIKKVGEYTDCEKQNKIPMALTGILNTPIEEIYKKTVEKLLVYWTFIIRLPVWGLKGDRKNKDGKLFIEEWLNKLKFEQYTIDELSKNDKDLVISTYRKGTTLHTYLTKQLMKDKEEKWQKVVEVPFMKGKINGKEINEFNNLNEVDIAFSLDPWNCPDWQDRKIFTQPSYPYYFTSIILSARFKPTQEGQSLSKFEEVICKIKDLSQKYIQMGFYNMEVLLEKVKNLRIEESSKCEEALHLLFKERIYDVDYSSYSFLNEFSKGKLPPYQQKIVTGQSFYGGRYLEMRGLQAEYQKQLIMNSSIAIIMDSFAHNIAAHSMPSTIGYLAKKIKETPDEGNSLLLRRVIHSYQSLIESSDFWMEGIRSERSISGQIINLYDILVDFVDNSLFLGSISATEHFTTVIIKVKIPCYETPEIFAVIDLDIGTVRWGYDKNQNPAFDRYIEERENGTYETCKGKELLKPLLVNKVKNIEMKNIEMRKDDLNKLQEMKIYFPGGVSGKKALYTIFENILRNGKHLEKRNGYLILNIEILEKTNLPKWKFKISLGEKSRKLNNGVTRTKKAFETGVMKKDRTPNMGGSGQMLICAGILNELTLWETHEKARKKEYKEFIDVNISSCENLEYTVPLWKGMECEKYSDVKESLKKGRENVHRFKILTILQGERKELEKFCKAKETYIPVRLVEDKEKSYTGAYQEWLKKLNICPNEGSEEKKEKEITILGAVTAKGTLPCVSKEYIFYHNLTTTFKDLSCRGHMILVKNFTNGKELQNKEELIEILETKIEIHDSRVYNFAEELKGTNGESLKDLLKKELNMVIYPDVENKRDIDQIINNKDLSHFMVVHISPFISALHQLDSKQETINKIKTKIKTKFKDCRFLIFTSGKGRKEEIVEGGYNIRFINFANFDNVINTARRSKGEEAFVMKYGFVKVLYGS